MRIQNALRHISSFQTIIFGFASVILLGALLLMLPISSKEMVWTPFANALFTSLSATCVTGLVVYNTAEYWSIFGQTIILILIQIGGMGVVTVAIAASMLSGKKIGLMQRSTMQEAISAPQVGGIVKMTGFILKTTGIIEISGAICLMPYFCYRYSWKGIWYAVFHSISAFCNAGFDLMGTVDGKTSLMQFTGNPFVTIPIMLLIIIGGIGFLTWDDFCKNKFHFRKYRMQSKAVLLTTAILLIVPAVFYFFYEFSREQWADLSMTERILASVFQAVTPRTAGFNTVDLSLMDNNSKLIMIILMLIGGSSGSTAGGLKVTTVAVIIMTVWAVFNHRAEVQGFGRRIAPGSIYNAVAFLILYFVLFLSGGMAISIIESVPLITALFESASAVGTVGLSLGLTPELGIISKCILMMLMFLGRVGGLTLVFAFISEKHLVYSKFPEEKITVG